MKKNVKNELKQKQAVCKVYTECFSGENYMLSDKIRQNQTVEDLWFNPLPHDGPVLCKDLR